MSDTTKTRARQTERRFILQGETELVVETTDERRRIVHHAPPWDVLSAPLWEQRVGGRTLPVRERFLRGAFEGILAGDVVALRDHDMSRVLGRTLSGTLRLEEDDVGLRYEVEPPDTSDGRDVLALIERGDVRGSSFSFKVTEGGDRWEFVDAELRTVARGEAAIILRTVTQVTFLGDIGPVTFPAYSADEVGLRSAGWCEDAARGFERWVAEGGVGAVVAEMRRHQMIHELGAG